MLYRRQERIPNELGTAVNVVAMVFGNTGPDSGTGVCFTRDPATGAQGVYGDYLQNAQGEDVVAGIRNTVPLAQLEEIDKSSYDELLRIMAVLEGHYRDLCDIEFTIERGKLWMLQTRVGKRTAAAAFRIATQLVDEGLIDADEAVRRVIGGAAGAADVPAVRRRREEADRVGRGMSASPGAAVGKAVFDSYTAVKWSRSGEKVILVRRETNPDDLNGMIAAEGILTSRGGKTSHAAVVARGMGKTCVCGAEELDVDTKRRRLTAPDGTVIDEGDVISVDGSSGLVYAGEVPVVAPPVVEYFEGTPGRGRRRGRRPRPGGAPHHVAGRRGAAAAGPRQRGHGGGRRAGAAVRRRGDRAVPHRAHVPGRAAPARGAVDPRGGRRAARAGAGGAAAVAAVGLPADPHRDGRAADDDPAAGPAAARVPAGHHRAVGAGGAGRGARGEERERPAAHAGRALVARAEPDARPARGPARPRRPRPVRPAGAGDRGGHRPADQDGPATRSRRS